MSTTFANGYTGFHSYTYNAESYACLKEADDCKNVIGAHPNNYYACGPCQAKSNLESMIMTLKSDDAQRYEAQQRLKSGDPLPLHKEVKKLHKKFLEKGGSIKIIKVPTIIMGPCGKRIATIKY